jgi:hypothetical protein
MNMKINGFRTATVDQVLAALEQYRTAYGGSARLISIDFATIHMSDEDDGDTTYITVSLLPGTCAPAPNVVSFEKTIPH